MDHMYLENLDEFISDEGKVITYKWLSLSLKVHANVAKQMLYHFVSKQRNDDKGDNLNVTYLVSGIMAGKDDEPDVQKVALVREENLASTKSAMKAVISIHVYSVSKAKLKDLSILHTADYDEVKKNLASINKYSGIECLCAKVRSAADLQNLQQQNAYQAPVETAPLQKKNKVVPKIELPKKEPVKEENISESSSTNAGKISNNQIASMFARQATKPGEKKKDKVETTKSSGSKKQGGISSFFNKGPTSQKQPLTPDSTKTSSPAKTKLTNDSSSPSPLETPTISEADSSPTMTESLISSSVKTESQETTLESQTESMEVETLPPKKGKTKTQSKLKPKTNTKKKGKSKGSDDENPIPKRRRIMAMSDSDSSDGEENEEDDESPLPPSPVPDPVSIESDEEEIPPTPQPEPSEERISKNGKAKKRKMVSKTYMDDEGFIVTKKEFEYVTDSEEEEMKSNEENNSAKSNVSSPQKTSKRSPTKKAAARSPTKKPSKKDLTKTKQCSIMSFFGKK